MAGAPSSKLTFVADKHQALVTRKQTPEEIRRRDQWIRWLLSTDAEKGPSIARLDFGPLRRMQQLSTYLELQFPTSTERAGFSSEGALLTMAPHVDNSVEAIGLMIDAICFGHSSVRTQDEAQLHYANKFYGTALTSLARTFADPSHVRQRPQVLLYAILLLNTYERTMGLPDRWNTWFAHLRGIRALCMASSRKLLYLKRPWDVKMLCYLQVVNFFMGVALRQPGPYEWLASPTYVEYSEETPPMLTLLLYVKGIPAILARVDAYLANRSDSRELRSIRKSIESTAGCLRIWYEQTSGYMGKPPEPCSDEASDNGLLASSLLNSSEVFGPCFNFNLEKTAEAFSILEISCLVLDCTLLRLIYFRPECDHLTEARSETSIKKSAFSHASNLCRTIYAFCDNKSIALFGLADTIAETALNFFTETEATKEAAWCRNAQSAIKERQARLPTAQPAGISGLDGLSEAIASFASYRAATLGVRTDGGKSE